MGRKFKVGDRVWVVSMKTAGHVTRVVPYGALTSYSLVDDNGDPIIGLRGRFQDHQLEPLDTTEEA